MTTTIDGLPDLAGSLTGAERIAVDVPIGGGDFLTQDVALSTVAAYVATTVGVDDAIAAADTATTAAETATTAATSATSSASTASTAATNLAALLASFRGVFLGAFATDTAADNFATANSITKASGLMFENTTSNKFRIWSGSAWGDYDASATASQSAAALSASNSAASAATATSQATAAAGSVTLASQWASLTGAQVATTDYSAKEYAIGTTVAVGSAKSWATSTTTVAGGLKGAKGYADDAATSATLAGNWAAKTTGTVDGTYKSAYLYALDAAASAAAASSGQVNSDWNAVSGVEQILNKPTLVASATTDTTNAANITAGILPAARLPAPTTGALGGVKSSTAGSHQFATGIGTDGIVTYAQPAAADISGLGAAATLSVGTATGTVAAGDDSRIVGALSKSGGTMTGSLNLVAFTDISSASTTDLGSIASNLLNITGTVSIVSLGTITAGVWRLVKFAGALTLTYNATSLILPGAASITTAAGDTAIFVSEGAGNWRCQNFTRASGKPIVANTVSEVGAVTPPGGTAILKANSGSGTLLSAVAGTDYLAPPSGTALLKAASGGALANAVAGTDYLAPPSGSAILKANSGGALANATAGTDYLAPGTAATITATQTFNGSASAVAAIFGHCAEVTQISGSAPSSTQNFDISSGPILVHTANAANNWAVNLRSGASNTLDSIMSVGQTITVVHEATQGSTAYYCTSVQVDGTTSGVTTKWIGGAPSAGNQSGWDAYSYAITKTGSATFRVRASVVQFK